MSKDQHKRGPDPHDLDTLQGSVNDSAGQAVVLWSSFLLFGLYLSIAAGSVTHRDLFLDRPIKLPVLDVDLPVDGFFAIAPIVYLIFHAYLLLQLLRLASKLAAWRSELAAAVTDPNEQRLMLLRFSDFPFLQFLADREYKRLGASRLILLSISWITLTLFPVLLLLQMQLVFLPAHEAFITWLQRCAIAIELSFAFLFWRSLDPGTSIRQRNIVLRAMGAVAAAVVLAFSIAFATFPGELFETNWIEGGTNWIASLFVADKNRPLSHLLFGGSVDEATGSTSSLFANRLILPGEKFYEGDDTKGGAPSISLRGRDLSHAILQNADLRFADFRGANLSGADLYQARLDGARFDCPGKIALRRVTDQKPVTEQRPAEEGEENSDEDSDATPRRMPPGQQEFAEYVPTDPKSCVGLLAGIDLAGVRAPRASFRYADLSTANFAKNDFSYASFDGADLRHAQLIRANLREDTFNGADLRGATLEEAQASGALFSKARLQGANISGAELWGTDFKGAWMQGANAEYAGLDGSVFTGAHLEGASFESTGLESAKMNQVQAQGANFEHADLTTAILIGSQFQGADFSDATVDLANFSSANLYRTRFGTANGRPMFREIDLSNNYPKLHTNQRPPGFVEDSEPTQLDATGFASLRARAIYGVDDPAVVASIGERLATLNPATRFADTDAKVLVWSKDPALQLSRLSPLRKAAWLERMCAPKGAPYVARFLIKELSRFGGFGEAMAPKVKDTANCPGAKGLTEEDLKPLAPYMIPEPNRGD